MSKHLAPTQLAQIADIVEAPHARHVVDRSFGLPGGLYVLTVGAYLAFFGVMAAAFLSGELAIPMVIFVVYIAMAFGVPALWTRIGADDGARSLSWSRFQSSGIMTADGQVPAGAAMVQVLILPFIVLAWAIVIAVIAAVL